MIIICEKYANSHSIIFNPNKSKLLCFNVDGTDVIPQTYLNGEVIPVVDSDKHLGNYISTNIIDRNIIDNICDLYQRSNKVISDFRVGDSKALDSLHRPYCMHMYGCELWDLNCNYIKDFKVAWRKITLNQKFLLVAPDTLSETLLCSTQLLGTNMRDTHCIIN